MEPKRRTSRHDKAVIAAACRVRGIAYRARLSEVSQHGCRIEMACETIQPGERVVLQLGRVLVVPAIVRRVADGQSDLEFVNPLHGAMLSQFASRTSHRNRSGLRVSRRASLNRNIRWSCYEV